MRWDPGSGPPNEVVNFLIFVVQFTMKSYFFFFALPKGFKEYFWECGSGENRMRQNFRENLTFSKCITLCLYSNSYNEGTEHTIAEILFNIICIYRTLSKEGLYWGFAIAPAHTLHKFESTLALPKVIVCKSLPNLM